MIPVNSIALEGNEKKYLARCIDENWISSGGEFVHRLEETVCKRVNRKYGVAVSSGSAALDVAVAALGLSPGDEVILPTFTIISCALSIVRQGLVPVVIDSDPETWNMDVSKIEESITDRTKAIMVVHIYGLSTDMKAVLDIAREYNLLVIEDSSQAIGQYYEGKPCGSFGDISTFSFYSNKLITTGEGGLVATNDDIIFEKCQSLRNLCFGKEQRFIHSNLGWNYRMSNLQAAVGVAQAEQWEISLRKKKQIGKKYRAGLQDLGKLQLPAENFGNAENIYWVFGTVLKDTNLCRDDVTRNLFGLGIETRPFFYPMHKQPIFEKMEWTSRARCPRAEWLSQNGFYLPSGRGLSSDQLDTVIEKMRKILR